MKNRTYNRLMSLAWAERYLQTEEQTCVTGETVKILEPGEWDERTELFINAEIQMNGTIRRGDVMVGRELEQPGMPGGMPIHRLYADRAILQLIAAPGTPLCRSDGSLVPQLVADIPETVREKYNVLLTSNGDCAQSIRDLDPFQRVTLMTRLLSERLYRKYNELMDFHRGAGENWNETLYIMLFRTMGDVVNKKPFTLLAHVVPYSVVSHERGSLFKLEALLLGASGLLERQVEDEYVLALKREFEYLQRKYNITPLRPLVWERAGIQPYNTPVLRIAQLAALLYSKEFMFDKVIACRTPKDVQQLFSAEASDYWFEHFTLDQKSAQSPKRIGEVKANLLGINMVVPMIFAYGSFLGDEELRDSATTLLERIPAEDNKYIRSWNNGGITVTNAFDSQALLELSRMYCNEERCAECSLGKSVIKEKYRTLTAQTV